MNALRSPACSSAAQPARRHPAGRGDRAAHGQRVHMVREQQRRRAGERVGDQLRRLRRRDPLPHRRINPRLGDQRHVGGRDAADRGRGIHQPLGQPHDGADAAEQLLDLGDGRATHAGHPAAHLDGGVGHRPHHPRLGIGGAEGRDGHSAEQRHNDRHRPDLARHRLELRRLVGQEDQLRALPELLVGADRLAADLGGERRRASRPPVGEQRRLLELEAEHERASHVPRSGKPDDHQTKATGRQRAEPQASFQPCEPESPGVAWCSPRRTASNQA